MRLPRDLSGRDLVKALARLGYEVDLQTGSHIRLTTHRRGEHAHGNLGGVTPGARPIQAGLRFIRAAC